MTLEHGTPSHDAFSALFRILDPDCLGRALLRLAADWAERLGPDVIAIDGKTLRSSFEDAVKRTAARGQRLRHRRAPDARTGQGRRQVQ